MHLQQITPEELARLATVATFGEAAEIAIDVLRRLAADGDPVVQICGPMSTGGLGSVAANMARFRRAVNAAHENGLRVFDQIPFQDVIIRLSDFREGADASYCHEILEVFYRRIFESGHVKRTLFLAGWQQSTGASWEWQLVGQLGIPAEDYPAHWLE